MHHLLDSFSTKHWREIQNASSQIAGRKPRRNRYHLDGPREMQDRRRQSAFKDIAGSDRHQVRQWVREDGSHNDHLKQGHQGSLSNALRHTLHVMHHVYQRDLHAHHGEGEEKVGGGLLDDVGNFVKKDVIESGAKQFSHEVDRFERATKEVPKGLTRIGDTLEGTARHMGVQADIAGDSYLHDV